MAAIFELVSDCWAKNKGYTYGTCHLPYFIFSKSEMSPRVLMRENLSDTFGSYLVKIKSIKFPEWRLFQRIMMGYFWSEKYKFGSDRSDLLLIEFRLSQSKDSFFKNTSWIPHANAILFFCRRSHFWAILITVFMRIAGIAGTLLLL